jgi:diadenosine tetraphosphate (Ap4A) HIT family hydrolase
MNNACYPWIILVPEREYVTEITDLSIAGRALLMEETVAVATILKQIYHPDKVNVAALGNVVPQLHMHIVARFTDDRSWPDPVWGKGKPREYYTEEAKENTLNILRVNLMTLPDFNRTNT